MMSTNRSRIAVVMLVLVVTGMLGGFGIVWWRQAHPDFARYTDALEAMRAHHIDTDSEGRVNLSRQFPGLTPNDFALVTWLEDGSFRAVFPTYKDLKGAALAGLMYTSRPLREEDTNARISAVHFDQRTIRVGSYSALIVEQRLNEKWYKVSYKLH